MKHLKKLLHLLPAISILIICFSINTNTFAAWDDIDVDYYIIPKISEKSKIKIQSGTQEIWKSWWKVMEKYKEIANSLTAEEQLNSWIMTRDTIMNYLVFVIKFLGQIWLVIWVWFIMYAGYKYMINVFGWNTADKTMISNAIIWVIIIIFSYAIMRFFLAIVWLS